VDRNVTKAQTLGTIATYMRNWMKGYGGKPVPYIEVENGGRLVELGVSAGTFVPAAYSWNESGKLITPENAPAHVVQTQEHNGVKKFQGTIDIGNTRVGAPHVWWDRPGGKVPGGSTGSTGTVTSKEFDVADVKDVWTGAAVDIIQPNPSITADDNPTWAPKGSLEWLINHLDSTETKVEALTKAVAALATKQSTPIDTAALAKALAPLLPAADVDEASLATALAGAIVQLAAGNA
jgi:hypothetical protein